ncbi:MAG: XrtB/PEP-CTERM-associated polysaccharide biosynthesis outer membrane protein EpsL [Methylococcales bacterium]
MAIETFIVRSTTLFRGMLFGMLTYVNAPAAPLPGDTFKPYVSTTLLYDSNLLRIADNLSPQVVAGKNNKDDFVKTVAGGFEMDWEVSRQHLILNAQINQSWFQNFNELDYLGWDTQAKWKWQIGNNFSGDIGYANKRSLGTFAQLNRLVQNLQNNQAAFVNAAYLLHPSWRVKIGGSRNAIRFDAESRQNSNRVEQGGEITVEYLSSTDSSLGLRLIGIDGRFPDRSVAFSNIFDNSYVRWNYSAIADWHFSSISEIKADIGYTEQEFEHLTNLNFADIVAHLKFQWAFSEKTLFVLSGWREIRQAFNQFGNFLLSQGAELSPRWLITPMLELSPTLSYEHQDYLGVGSLAAQSGPDTINTGRRDNIWNIGLNLTYRPIDNATIGLVLAQENRQSTQIGRTYQTQSALLNVQLAF